MGSQGDGVIAIVIFIIEVYLFKKLLIVEISTKRKADLTSLLQSGDDITVEGVSVFRTFSEHLFDFLIGVCLSR